MFTCLCQRLLFAMILLSLTLNAFKSEAAGKPLKVYILAGQSNMEGHAMTRTFDYIGEDPKTAPLLKLMRDDAGNNVVAEHVYISNLTGFFDNHGVLNGKLTAGFGARRDPGLLGDKIGPELTFGLTLAQSYDGPILLIKCAWGGKSLHTDFRPPSAGPYQFNASQLERFTQQGKDLEEVKAEKAKATGHYYRMMMEHVKTVLADPAKFCAAYDAKAGHEIAGFVWFQGWNDLVDSGTYPNRAEPGGYDAYSKVMGLFINDVRSDLNEPNMPFVIGVMGVGGPIDPDSPNKTQQNFREAMAAPAKTMKHVAAVETSLYWDQDLDAIDAKRGQVKQMAQLLKTKNKKGPNAEGNMSEADQKAYLEKYKAELITAEDEAKWERGASNAGYHYLGCGKTMAQIGAAFAEAVLKLEK